MDHTFARTTTDPDGTGREDDAAGGELRAWIDDDSAALLTDLYELTMLQAYWREGMQDQATFSLFVRRLPRTRNYLLACGLDAVLRYLERLRFGPAALAALAARPELSPDFVRWLGELRFEGDVYAVAEGTPVFAGEPILEVVAPLPQAQLVETFLLNQVHLQTVLASKATRVVHAAAGRAVVDFGLRRMHGTDAGLAGARAFHVAGVSATSNVLAGRVFGIPVAGTMAHSYVQAHEREDQAFARFVESFPQGVLLVDTYDTLTGVRRVVELARRLGDRFAVRGVRLDSGDLAQLARGARRILDDAGLQRVQVFASGGLDEYAIAELLANGAPIDGFGVGTAMAVSADAPALDVVYKLTAYAGRGRLKQSTDKETLPGPKQVFRREANGVALGDTIARFGERLEGRPLLQQVMARGRRLDSVPRDLNAVRQRAQQEVALLPAHVRDLGPAAPPYPVALSDALGAYRDRVAAEVAQTRGSGEHQERSADA